MARKRGLAGVALALGALGSAAACGSDATTAEPARATRASVASGRHWVRTAFMNGRPQGFGYAVAVSADTLIVGQGLDYTIPGSAFVFARSAGGWTLQQELSHSDAEVEDWFGTAVAISGNTALVGAQRLSGQRGAAYVYERSGTAWSERAKLLASDGAAADNFGGALALEGDTALVAAPNYNGLDQENGVGAGAVYAYARSGTIWSEAKLTNPELGYFGRVLSLSGDTALIGGYGLGAYGRSNGVWSEVQRLVPATAQTLATLSGDFAVINNQTYERAGGVWPQQGAALESDLGFKQYTLSGDTAVESLLGAEVIVRRHSGTTWPAELTVTSSDLAAGQAVTLTSVAIFGSVLAIGALYGGNQPQYQSLVAVYEADVPCSPSANCPAGAVCNAGGVCQSATDLGEAGAAGANDGVVGSGGSLGGNGGSQSGTAGIGVAGGGGSLSGSAGSATGGTDGGSTASPCSDCKESSSCGCRLPSSAPGASAGWSALLLAGVLVRRRARRASS